MIEASADAVRKAYGELESDDGEEDVIEDAGGDAIIDNDIENETLDGEWEDSTQSWNSDADVDERGVIVMCL